MAIRVVDRKVSLSLSLSPFVLRKVVDKKFFLLSLFVPILHFAYDCAHRLFSGNFIDM